MWWPQRFEVLTAIGLAVVAGAGLDAWLRGRSRTRMGVGLVALLVVADAPWRSGVSGPREQAPAVSAPLYRNLDGPLLTTPIRPSVRFQPPALAATQTSSPFSTATASTFLDTPP